jgi:hypothetical protein
MEAQKKLPKFNPKPTGKRSKINIFTIVDFREITLVSMGSSNISTIIREVSTLIRLRRFL